MLHAGGPPRDRGIVVLVLARDAADAATAATVDQGQVDQDERGTGKNAAEAGGQKSTCGEPQ